MTITVLQKVCVWGGVGGTPVPVLQADLPINLSTKRWFKFFLVTAIIRINTKKPFTKWTRGSVYEWNNYYLHHPFQRHLLFKCHRNGRQLSQKLKGSVPKNVLPATINCLPHSSHSHTLNLWVISLRMLEVYNWWIHYIKSV